MAMSSQEVRGRVRAPRVHIKYEVEKEGAIEMISLPFVLGMMADLSGHTAKPALAAREFTEISAVTFEDTLRSIGPSLRISVENRLQEKKGEMLSADLKFESLADFEPASIAEKLGPTKQLLETRRKLHNLVTRLEGQAEADEMLKEVIRMTGELGETKKEDANG